MAQSKNTDAVRPGKQVDPVSELPPGFPAMHSRIRPTPSKFVVAAVQSVTLAEPDVELTFDDQAIREQMRARLQRVVRRR